MYLFISSSSDPCFNLATEEFLLKNFTDNIIFLYRNCPSIVIGKHQNAMAEINYRFVIENNIAVVRRISGGGTVYHDEGNVNFTFLQNGEEGNLVNFKAFILPIVDFLKQLGIDATIGPRNDILINGLKVSGNAEHVFRKRTLHHGTLLYSSTLTDLRNALHIDGEKYLDRAVKSVRSIVTNIKEYIPEPIDTLQFFDSLSDYLFNYYTASLLQLTDDAVAEIQNLANTKYSDWQWNFGYSPDYVFRNSVNTNTGTLSMEFKVEKGAIKNLNIEGNLDQKVLHDLNASLLNEKHSYDSLSKNSNIIKLESILNLRNREILWSLF